MTGKKPQHCQFVDQGCMNTVLLNQFNKVQWTIHFLIGKSVLKKSIQEYKGGYLTTFEKNNKFKGSRFSPTLLKIRKL